MRPRSVQVSADGLEAGMVLGQDVLDPQGRLLLSAGTVLDERQARLLRLRGGDLLVVRPEAQAEQPIPPERLEAAAARVRPRFVLHDPGHPLSAALLEYCALRLAEEERS